jgi:ABC-2 type transport system ATP-binding protein
VPAGTVLGLLGHNGAGKTTAVRILTTLAAPTTGSAQVAGHDVVADAAAVRASIGLAAQAATVDGLLTARRNLELVGRLYHLPRGVARARADELLERLDLADAADRLVKTFSGGMRRRLDLAATLVASPPVLFLDEPTTGLDPHSRNELWELLRELVRDGTTVLLTTQYLEEADRLADDIVVLDHGRAVATGSPEALKARIGGERIDVKVEALEDLPAGEAALAPFADGPSSVDADALIVTIPVVAGTSLLEVARALDAADVAATDVHRREATLDDVFLSLTTKVAA